MEGILEQWIKDMLKKCESFLGKGIVMSAPASANWVSSLESDFNIIIIHQKRHFLQAERVLAAKNLSD